MSTSATASLVERVQALDAAVLTPIVRRASGCAGTLTHWEVVALNILHGGLGASAIFRFSGAIQGTGAELAWSVILKVIAPGLPTKGPMLSSYLDCRREYELYNSDLGRQFPAGFRAARAYDLSERTNPEGEPEFWEWLEDLGPFTRSPWRPEDHYQAAVGVGKFNGIYLAGQPLPEVPWLKQDLTRQYLQLTAPSFERLAAQRDWPVVRRIYPPEEVDSLLQLWQEREQHLALLDRLPQTLCHGDAQYTNLFLVPTPAGECETVAIDWGAIGPRNIGMDLSHMLGLAMTRADPVSMPVIEAALFEGYLDGLRAAGWQGDARLARLGLTASMLKVRATFVLRPLSFFTDQGEPKEVFAGYLKQTGTSLDQWFEASAWMNPYVRRLFEESLELRAQLL